MKTMTEGAEGAAPGRAPIRKGGKRLRFALDAIEYDVSATSLEDVVAAAALLKIAYAELDAAYVQLSAAAVDRFDRRTSLSMDFEGVTAFVPGPKVDVYDAEGLRGALLDLWQQGKVRRGMVLAAVPLKHEVGLEREGVKRLLDLGVPEVSAAVEAHRDRQDRRTRTLQFRARRSRKAAA